MTIKLHHNRFVTFVGVWVGLASNCCVGATNAEFCKPFFIMYLTIVSFKNTPRRTHTHTHTYLNWLIVEVDKAQTNCVSFANCAIIKFVLISCEYAYNYEFVVRKLIT